MRGIRPSSQPTFYFKHILLPHAPWRSCRRVAPSRAGRRSAATPWNLQHFNRWLVNQSYQRHLLQVGFTDRLLGKVLDRLRASGLSERSLFQRAACTTARW
jgi:Sulfatase